MPDLHVWLADSNGYLVGELDATGVTDDLATFTANAAKNGQTAIDKVSGDRPPTRPPGVEAVAQGVKGARLAALQKKGFANLTAAEKDEGQALRFDLGL